MQSTGCAIWVAKLALWCTDWHKLMMPPLYKSSVNWAGWEGFSCVTLNLWSTLCTCCSGHYPKLQNLALFLELKCAWEHPVCLMCFLKGENMQRPVGTLPKRGTCLCWYLKRLGSLQNESDCLSLTFILQWNTGKLQKVLSMPICSRSMADFKTVLS